MGLMFDKEMLENCKVISVKQGKKYEKNLRIIILKEYRKYFAQTLKRAFWWRFCELFKSIFGRRYERSKDCM